MPFLIYAGVQTLILLMLVGFTVPPLRFFVPSLLRLRFGDEALHYPNNFMVLQRSLGEVDIILSVFLGGKRRSRSLSGAASRRSQTVRTQERLRSAQEKLSDKAADLVALEDDLADDLMEITQRWNDAAAAIETIEIGLEKTDIAVDELALAWVPIGSREAGKESS